MTYADLEAYVNKFRDVSSIDVKNADIVIRLTSKADEEFNSVDTHEDFTIDSVEFASWWRQTITGEQRAEIRLHISN